MLLDEIAAVATSSAFELTIVAPPLSVPPMLMLPAVDVMLMLPVPASIATSMSIALPWSRILPLPVGKRLTPSIFSVPPDFASTTSPLAVIPPDSVMPMVESRSTLPPVVISTVLSNVVPANAVNPALANVDGLFTKSIAPELFRVTRAETVLLETPSTLMSLTLPPAPMVKLAAVIRLSAASSRTPLAPRSSAPAVWRLTSTSPVVVTLPATSKLSLISVIVFAPASTVSPAETVMIPPVALRVTLPLAVMLSTVMTPAVEVKATAATVVKSVSSSVMLAAWSVKSVPAPNASDIAPLSVIAPDAVKSILPTVAASPSNSLSKIWNGLVPSPVSPTAMIPVP